MTEPTTRRQNCGKNVSGQKKVQFKAQTVISTDSCKCFWLKKKTFFVYYDLLSLRHGAQVNDQEQH